ncbi:hypothetical protein BX666DRAFT_2022023 [Dichotomocladium elegans]|nr:hypothetical protein BX666DRAFT_2022023 [Dichotomocladium elegans]
MSDVKNSGSIPTDLDRTWTGHETAYAACQAWAKKQGYALYTCKSSYKGSKKYRRISCKHHGVPRNQDELPEAVPGPTAIIVDSQGNSVSSTEVKKHNKKHSQYVTTYPIHRRFDNKTEHLVIQMVESGFKDGAIATLLTEQGSLVKAKDIANLRQKQFSNDPGDLMFKLIRALENNLLILPQNPFLNRDVRNLFIVNSFLFNMAQFALKAIRQFPSTTKTSYSQCSMRRWIAATSINPYETYVQAS